MVHYSLVMVLCLNFMLFRVSRRSRARDARGFSYVFVRFRTVQYESNKISRFYALTPKITYLGRFSNCVVRCSRKLAGLHSARVYILLVCALARAGTLHVKSTLQP